jgi:hypothetical protein
MRGGLQDEGRLLALLAGARVPTMLGHEGGRMLLAEIAGKDLYASCRCSRKW